MTPEEESSFIASYMGGPYIGDACMGHDSANIPLDYCKKEYVCCYCKHIPKFYLSFDNLALVWEKLGVTDARFGCQYSPRCNVYLLTIKGRQVRGEGSTVQEAARSATVNAIKEVE